MRKIFLIAIFLTPFFYSNAYADEWVFCANENEYCNFSGEKVIFYGVGNLWTNLKIKNGTLCNNNVFGDPARGTRKGCYYMKDKKKHRWDFCAKEGGKCNFSGSKEIRYGAIERYKYKTLKNGTDCNNHVFGDPAHGVRKACYVKNWY